MNAYLEQGQCQMNKTADVQWPNYEVIEVENTLRTKALVPGNPADAITTATKRADRAVDQLSVEFPAWMRHESERLNEIRCAIADQGSSAERIDQLFTCAHDIKGQAQTFGYPVAGVIGKLLCDLIEHAPDPVKIPLPVIDQHVDTVRAIVKQDLKGEGNRQTSNIIQGLHVLGRATLKKISAQAAPAG